jgi:hypothetical protein
MIYFCFASDTILMRSCSGHDTPQTTPLRNRRLGHHQQVRVSSPSDIPFFVSLPMRVTHVRPCRKRGKPAKAQVLFSVVMRATKHTKPRAGHGVTSSSWYPSRTASSDTVARHDANVESRGSKFLKSWMDFLEENADLRYPNLADVYVDEQNG